MRKVTIAVGNDGLSLIGRYRVMCLYAPWEQKFKGQDRSAVHVNDSETIQGVEKQRKSR